MSISFKCECGRSLRVKDELAGKQGRCPACGTLLRIPVPEPEGEDAANYLLTEAPQAKPAARRSRREEPEPEAESEPEPPRRRSREPERIDQAPKLARDVRKKKSRPRKERGRSGVAFEEGWFGGTNAGMVGGVLMMVIAVVWFVLGIALIDRIFFYPPILFILGVISFIKGLAGGE
jgi:hypothetical protein